MAAAPVRVPATVWVGAEIKLTDTPPIVVSPDPVELSISKNQEVQWFCTRRNPNTNVFVIPESVTIDFASDSPFAEATFIVPAGGSVCSGPVKHGAQKRSYKYTILNTVTKAKLVDPQVIIKD